MPSILEAAGVSPDPSVDGVDQQAIDGASMLSTMDDASSPAPRDTQYFEMLGSRAIYHDGWKATTDHLPFPEMWEPPMEGSVDFAKDHWALFDLGSDFSEAVDLADAEPDRLAGMVGLWEAEAERNQVLPISDSGERPDSIRSLRDDPRPREVYFAGSQPVTTSDLLAGSFELTAELVAGPESSGVLWAHHPNPYTFSTRAIWSCHVVDGVPILTFGLTGGHRIPSSLPMTEGRHTLVVRFRREADGARVTVSLDREQAAELSIPQLHVPPVRQLYIGRGVGVRWDDFDPSRGFHGTIVRVTVERTPAPRS